LSDCGFRSVRGATTLQNNLDRQPSLKPGPLVSILFRIVLNTKTAIMPRAALLLPVLLTLSGCASVLLPDNQHSRILVTTSCGPVENVGARCVMTGGGTSAAFDAPAEVRVPNAWNLLTVECQGEMLGSASTVIFPKPNLGMVGNLLVGGAPGALVDTATGRGLNYDRHVNLHRNQCFR